MLIRVFSSLSSPFSHRPLCFNKQGIIIGINDMSQRVRATSKWPILIGAGDRSVIR